jgi:hypothetical protein
VTIILSLSTLLLSACTTTQIIQEAVTDPGKRYEFENFSVLPPQGDNWFLIFSKEQSGKALLMFGKEVKPGTPLGIKSFQPHTVRADVTAQRVGDEDVGSPQKFFDMIKQSAQANTSKRFVVLEEEYSPYKKIGEYCVLVETHTEDHNVPSDPGNVYQFRYTSLFCYDRNTQMMVKVSCSQRVLDKKDLIASGRRLGFIVRIHHNFGSDAV